jgi:hypothetical protein
MRIPTFSIDLKKDFFCFHNSIYCGFKSESVNPLSYKSENLVSENAFLYMFAEGSNSLPYSSKIAESLSRPFLIINYTQYFSVDYLKYLFLNFIILNFLEAIIKIELSVCMKFFYL